MLKTQFYLDLEIRVWQPCIRIRLYYEHLDLYMCSIEFYHHYGKFRHEVLDWKAYMIVRLKVDI